MRREIRIRRTLLNAWFWTVVEVTGNGLIQIIARGEESNGLQAYLAAEIELDKQQ